MVKQKEKIGLSARVIIIRGSKVLVVRQQKPNGRDVYILPGGGIKPNEDIFTAAEREVAEESCLKIKVLRLLYLKELFSPNLHSFEFYVLGKVMGGKLDLGYDPELAKKRQVLKQIVFVSIKALKKLRFYPQELRIKLEKDSRRKFKNIAVHLGVQRFTPKQYKRLFESK
ncbi:MAG: NUDIX domain-containing protein [Patescibacteria group bacterium]